jgi:hypothetical protein
MNWVEQEMDSRNPMAVTPERERTLDWEKSNSLPLIAKEADSGEKQIVPIVFQPVQSPGNFEAEFGVKDGDLIFHFWPWHYHLDEKAGRMKRAFKKGFREALGTSMHASFEAPTITIAEDRDMGAWFVMVKGGGRHQFHRQRAITAVTALHKALGGE